MLAALSVAPQHPTALARHPEPLREAGGEAAERRVVSVLLVEDGSADALLAQAALQQATESGVTHRYTSRWAETLAQAREILSTQNTFDAAIVDLGLPDSEGLATLTAIRALVPHAAIVVLTARDDHETARNALHLGAEEYLVKGDVNYATLERAVRYALDRRAAAAERMRDMSEREQLQEQLRHAQRMEALGRLAGGVAHDFNNVLTVILGHAAMLQGGIIEPEEVAESLGEIRKAGECAARLTAQLLAFSRQQIASPKVLNLNAVVGDLEKTLLRLIGEHIHLVTQLAPSPPHVRVDPGHIEQVLMNLAVNARDAMPDGGYLTIRTEPVAVGDEFRRLRPYVNPGAYVQLSVVDTGIGMTEVVRARAFEPFFTTKGPGRGTGLGLATVYGIVKQAGGYIWCTSVPGMGTRFEIFLPATDAQLEPDIVVRYEHRAAAHERIIVVEDDPAVRAIVTRTLRDANYDVIEALDGERAVHQASQSSKPVQLLITDLVMPGMGGREVARRVSEILPNIRVVYMSGYTDDEVVRRGELPRNHLFLQKPFKGSDLLRMVDAALGRAALISP
jgi:two-component system, cell cycle sensor histidine kinase and response regulator CckA